MSVSTPLSPTIHFWTPGLLDCKGGIQTYSGFLLRSLQRLLPHVQIQVFSTHDYPPQQTDRPTQFHGFGSWPANLRIPAFATRVFLAGLQHRPQLIISTHANFTPAARPLKRLAGIPYWAVAHGFEVWDLKRDAVRRGLQEADRILAVSHYTRQRLLAEQALSPAQVSRLPNTFELERFRPAPKPTYLLEKYGLQPDQPICLTVNRLATGEAFHPYDQVLRALPHVRQSLPTLHYFIVGQGEDRSRVEQLIQHLNLSDCVTLTGFIPDSDLTDYYNLCDVFAMPSKLEGFGIVFLEAMACGKPVLGSHQDGGLDALDQGRLGALVDPDNLTEIADTLAQLFLKQYPNPLLYQPQSLRSSVIETYGPQAFERTLAKLLQQSPLAPPGFKMNGNFG
jgi:glycosyltransferase involved in cell wall biosynthesis